MMGNRHEKPRVTIKGAGDLASGVAHRLWMAGFKIVMLELPSPLVVRRTVSFASAVWEGKVEVEGVTGLLCKDVTEVEGLWSEGLIPVLVDPSAQSLSILKPHILVDAVLAKKNTGTSSSDAPVVIGLGPGFTAGQDVHAVVETQRGHNLGRVFYRGRAAPNTGSPGEIGGYSRERLLRSSAHGSFTPLKEIGDRVHKGELVGRVGDSPLKAQIDGVLRGLIHAGTAVTLGMKVGDVDPRENVLYHSISDKARSVAGGVLEAILHLSH